jgi:beta-glucosidase-like glycosyl hydrolase
LAKHESPFIAVMRANPNGAMLGHLLVKNADPKYPASLSKVFANQLRGIVGPNRLVFTDSGSMEALSRYGSEDLRAARALSVGVDVYLTTTPYAELGKHFDERVFRRVRWQALADASARVLGWRRARPNQ